MNSDLNAVYDAAMKLQPSERRRLITKLSISDSSFRPRVAGAVEKHFGTFSSGDPNSCDNEKIDADLAREYLDPHNPEN